MHSPTFVPRRDSFLRDPLATFSSPRASTEETSPAEGTSIPTDSGTRAFLNNSPSTMSLPFLNYSTNTIPCSREAFELFAHTYYRYRHYPIQGPVLEERL